MLNFSPASFSLEVGLSIHGEHAERMFSGAKRFELRKIVPRTIPRRLYLFEARGSSSVVGHAVVEQLVSGTPDEVWNHVGEAATTKTRFTEYFSGRPLAHAYEISCAVKYEKAVRLRELQAEEPELRFPQSFVYLNNYPNALKLLRARAFENALNDQDRDFQLRPLGSENRKEFLSLVQQHITESYAETGIIYANRLIDIHDHRSDEEGINTQSKVILEVHVEGLRAGYVVLTEKLGGAIKTGPTILLPDFQNRGLGIRLREAIDRHAFRQGYRKVYCTFPETKASRLSYLVRSGYSIEAHLKCHYHPNHGEFVLGHALAKYSFPDEYILREQLPIFKHSRVDAFSSEIADFLRERFSSYITPVNGDWSNRQVRAAAACAKGKVSSFKPRLLYRADGLGLVAIAFVLLKRGGSAKLTVLTDTDVESSIVDFIDHVMTVAKRRAPEIRKYYSHIPLLDSVAIRAFSAIGFTPEGVLRIPYSDTRSMLIMSRVLDADTANA